MPERKPLPANAQELAEDIHESFTEIGDALVGISGILASTPVASDLDTIYDRVSTLISTATRFTGNEAKQHLIDHLTPENTVPPTNPVGAFAGIGLSAADAGYSATWDGNVWIGAPKSVQGAITADPTVSHEPVPPPGASTQKPMTGHESFDEKPNPSVIDKPGQSPVPEGDDKDSDKPDPELQNNVPYPDQHVSLADTGNVDITASRAANVGYPEDNQQGENPPSGNSDNGTEQVSTEPSQEQPGSETGGNNTEPASSEATSAEPAQKPKTRKAIKPAVDAGEDNTALTAHKD